MKLHFLKTVWSDIILLEHEGTFAMVDTGFAEQFPQIQEYLDSLGVTRLSFILLTHFHRDHYGSIPKLLETYSVEKVYLKEYSGLDSTTAWGTAADDTYRSQQKQAYLSIQECIRKHSTLVQLEGLDHIFFGPYKLRLFFTANTIRSIYQDETHPETYQKISFSENQNSLGIFMQVDGINVFLGGDLLDLPSSHPLADRVVYQIARELGMPMDVYKVPHHATHNTGRPETLEILRPKLAIITNEEAYLTSNSDALQNLRNANPEVKILLTEKETVVLSLPECTTV